MLLLHPTFEWLFIIQFAPQLSGKAVKCIKCFLFIQIYISLEKIETINITFHTFIQLKDLIELVLLAEIPTTKHPIKRP
jgi:hypothetical protein